MLAAIAKKSGNYESAIDSLKQALRLRPEAIDTRTANWQKLTNWQVNLGRHLPSIGGAGS